MTVTASSTASLIRDTTFASPLTTAVTLSSHDMVPYQSPKHLRLLSRFIRNIVMTGGRGIITMPPRHGKSWMTSKWTPLWFLANWPHETVINCGYGSNFAKDWGRIVRDLAKQHAQSLPFRLQADSTAAEVWHTQYGGGMKTAGIGSGITGKGCELLIIDDPIKDWEEASSFTYREKVWSWYTSTARTRLHPGGAILVILTRWNEDDLAGRLLKQGAEDWQLLNLPAIYDEYAAGVGPDPLGRKIGEPLWPERYGLQELSVFQRQDAVVWNSLFQQRPGTVAGLGNVYHAFKRKNNVKKFIDRDNQRRMFVTFDFNVNPMCSTIGQYHEYYGPMSHVTNEKYALVEVLDEVCLPNSNTGEACEEIDRRLREMCGRYDVTLEIYGDPAGKARHTSQVSGSDWDIITNFFRSRKQYDTRICVKSKAPAIKDRINAVNKMMCNTLGEVQIHIHEKCKMLIRDLENVRWKVDASGNTTGQLDKSQSDLTHVSDSFGYFIEAKFGRGGDSGERQGVMQ